AGWQPLGFGQNGDLAVEVFSTQALTMGQNYLAYRVTAQGAQASAARVFQVPHMDMAGALHGSPVIDPPEAADDAALFQGISVFQMPSVADAAWRLDLEVEVPLGAAPRAVAIDNLKVTKSAWVATAKAADGTKSIVSLYFPKKPKVGLNPYTLSVHSDAGDDVTFPAIADATVKATPLMVTMGHGSSGNVAPVAKGGGLYAGKASFSMPGEWKLTFAISVAGKSLGSAAFKIVL
ncbi:MAG: FixH family protein, partial [Deltaproteobacteria bacterium]|nr:FixH family protein [Deltaproteobacteria bacterium]